MCVYACLCCEAKVAPENDGDSSSFGLRAGRPPSQMVTSTHSSIDYFRPSWSDVPLWSPVVEDWAGAHAYRICGTLSNSPTDSGSHCSARRPRRHRLLCCIRCCWGSGERQFWVLAKTTQSLNSSTKTVRWRGAR